MIERIFRAEFRPDTTPEEREHLRRVWSAIPTEIAGIERFNLAIDGLHLTLRLVFASTAAKTHYCEHLYHRQTVDPLTEALLRQETYSLEEHDF